MSGTLTMSAWCPSCVDVTGHYVSRGRPSKCRPCTARRASDDTPPEVRRDRVHRGIETLGPEGRRERTARANATLGAEGRRARSLRANASTSPALKRARGLACAHARWGDTSGGLITKTGRGLVPPVVGPAPAFVAPAGGGAAPL